MFKRGVKAVLGSLIITAIVAVTVLGFYFIATMATSADLEYNSLDYQVTVQDNGDLLVEQTIDMSLDRRENDDDEEIPWKQLYQRYTLNSANLTDITNISVENLDTGEQFTQTSPQLPDGIDEQTWNDEYANHWYIANVGTNGSSIYPFSSLDDSLEPTTAGALGAPDDGEHADTRVIELGWNIPYTSSAKHMRFRISMLWEGTAISYDDVAAFQWEPFGKENQTPIEQVHATIQFPEPLTADNSWMWLHYEGDGYIERKNGVIEATAYNVHAGEYFDVVAMVNCSMLPSVARTVSTDGKQTILDDETRQEQEWRDQERKSARITLIVWIIVAAIGIILGVAAIICAIRAVRRTQYRGPIEYWREPPQMSPAAAAQLYDVMNLSYGSTPVTNREYGATLMSLVTKHAVAVYPGPRSLYEQVDLEKNPMISLAQLRAYSGLDEAQLEKAMKKTSTIVILPRALAEHHERLNLSRSEEQLLRILQEAVERLHRPSFDLKEMSKAFKKWTDGYKETEKFAKACKQEFEDLHATAVVGSAAITCAVFEIILGALSSIYFLIIDNLWLLMAVSMPILFIGIFVAVFARLHGLAEPDNFYAGQVNGLAKYLEDFSEFEDRGVLDVVLWGRYLVYATAFGISEKAMTQLMSAYPQLHDTSWLDSNVIGASGLVYWSSSMGAGFSQGSSSGLSSGFTDFGTQLSAGFTSVQSTIAAAAPSGSGGSGGGGGMSFGGSSGGSGGGSFGGR